MDCGDAGHILLSKRVAEDLAQYAAWQPYLHPLGECEVKHGAKIDIVNFYGDEIGNPVTPEKLKNAKATLRPPRVFVIAAAAVLIVVGIAIGFAVLQYEQRSTRASALTAETRIAVLPFKPITPENSDKVLELGMANTLITKLSNVFAVEDAISQEVADALPLRLTAEQKPRLTEHYTENTEAYRLYLTGRYHWAKLIPSEIRTSITFFQQAIAKDLNFALAYVGLADANRTLSVTSDVPPKDCLPQAKAAAMKALEIDDSLAEAHATLALTLISYDWDWRGGEMEATRASALNPNSGMAHFAYAHILSDLGRHDEAIAEGAKAIEIEPVSLGADALYGIFLGHAHRDNQALMQLQKTLQLDPNFWLTHLMLGKVYAHQHRYPEALAEFNKAKELSHGDSETIGSIGYVAGLSGDKAKARAVLEELKPRSIQSYVPSFNIALVYNGLGDQDGAIQWQEKAVDEHDVLLNLLKVDPRWDSFRSNPQFIAILERIGLQ
jgi:tetratricopeptide (TPR) repeat protein